MAARTIALTDFFSQFKNALSDKASKELKPLYDGTNVTKYSEWLKELKRKPFKAQANAVQALMKLLLETNNKAGILCGDMGTGKTIVGISLAYLFSKMNRKRIMVLSPPHLVYKWKREIEETIPEARVIILNGADSISKLNRIRANKSKPSVPTFYIIGRVRLRLGGDWQTSVIHRKACAIRKSIKIGDKRVAILDDMNAKTKIVCCPKCGEPQMNAKKDKFILYASETKKWSVVVVKNSYGCQKDKNKIQVRSTEYIKPYAHYQL